MFLSSIRVAHHCDPTGGSKRTSLPSPGRSQSVSLVRSVSPPLRRSKQNQKQNNLLCVILSPLNSRNRSHCRPIPCSIESYQCLNMDSATAIASQPLPLRPQTSLRRFFNREDLSQAASLVSQRENQLIELISRPDQANHRQIAFFFCFFCWIGLNIMFIPHQYVKK